MCKLFVLEIMTWSYNCLEIIFSLDRNSCLNLYKYVQIIHTGKSYMKLCLEMNFLLNRNSCLKLYVQIIRTENSYMKL